MKYFLLIFFIIIATSFQNPQQPEKKLKFEFTLSQAEYILNTLQERPYKDAAPIIQLMMAQAGPQMQDTAKVKK